MHLQAAQHVWQTQTHVRMRQLICQCLLQLLVNGGIQAGSLQVIMITGKTLNITQQLTAGLPAEMVPVFLTFSARTSANQTQDIIDSKMDKRRKVGAELLLLLEQLVLPSVKPSL